MRVLPVRTAGEQPSEDVGMLMSQVGMLMRCLHRGEGTSPSQRGDGVEQQRKDIKNTCKCVFTSSAWGISAFEKSGRKRGFELAPTHGLSQKAAPTRPPCLSTCFRKTNTKVGTRIAPHLGKRLPQRVVIQVSRSTQRALGRVSAWVSWEKPSLVGRQHPPPHASSPAVGQRPSPR